MKVIYDHKTGIITIEIDGVSEKIGLNEFLQQIPDERAKYQWLLEHLRRVRQEKIDNLGDFMQKIIDLTKGESEVRERMKKLAEAGDYKAVRAYGEVVKAYLAEKTTLQEFRHAQKFLTFEEGKIMAELEDLEV